LRTSVLKEYLDLRKRKRQTTGENYLLRRSTISAFQQDDEMAWHVSLMEKLEKFGQTT
jgi:hypothetical protein